MENLLFELTEAEKIKECFEKNGVVVIKNILSDQEINSTLNDIENYIKQNCGDSFSLNDPNTFELIDGQINGNGVVGKVPIFTEHTIKNRLNSNLRQAFEILFGEESGPLMCQYDRIGWMRPTIGPNNEDFSKYRTTFDFHLDLDPIGYFDKNFESGSLKALNSLNYNNPKHYLKENGYKNFYHGKRMHGVLNLFNNQEPDGGFQCYLGGHLLVENWAQKAKPYLNKPSLNGRYVFKDFKEADSMFSNTTRITCPAGGLIIFDSRLPHGTKPNYTKNHRMVQYINYIPKKWFNSKKLQERKKALLEIFDKINFKPSDHELQFI